MKLTPMTESEFKIWEPRSRAAYAADKARSNSMTHIEAQEAADRALYRKDVDSFQTHIKNWPRDVKAHTLTLAASIFHIS